MAFKRFSTSNNTIIIPEENGYCDDRSFFQCHPAIGNIGFVILLLVIVLIVWKKGCFQVTSDNHEGVDTTTGNLESNSKKDNPSQLLAPLPYPQPPSENYEATKALEPNTPTSTLVDPYLVTNNIDKSLISKEDSFKRTEFPEPAFKRRESVIHSLAVVDLPETEPMVAHQLPELKLDPTIQMHDHDDKKKSITPNPLDLQPVTASPPPPVYVPSHTNSSHPEA